MGGEPELRDGNVYCEDGVAIACRGDFIVCVWRGDSSISRMRWISERFLPFARSKKGGVLAAIIMLPTSNPPSDRSTRQASERFIREAGPLCRRAVTVALGDGVRVNIVRTVIRLLVMAGKFGARHAVSATVQEALDDLYAHQSEHTPARDVVEALLRRTLAETTDTPA